MSTTNNNNTTTTTTPMVKRTTSQANLKEEGGPRRSIEPYPQRGSRGVLIGSREPTEAVISPMDQPSTERQFDLLLP